MRGLLHWHLFFFGMFLRDMEKFPLSVGQKEKVGYWRSWVVDWVSTFNPFSQLILFVGVAGGY